MAFDLPPLPFPKEPGTNNPYVATPDEGGVIQSPVGTTSREGRGFTFMGSCK